MGPLAMCARLVTKGSSDLRMHCINQPLRDLPGLIEQREVCWVSDISWDARGINQWGSLVGTCFVRARLHRLITAWKITIVVTILIILGLCGLNHVQSMTNDPLIAVIDH